VIFHLSPEFARSATRTVVDCSWSLAQRHSGCHARALLRCPCPQVPALAHDTAAVQQRLQALEADDTSASSRRRGC
jgi:hypothetical protein